MTNFEERLRRSLSRPEVDAPPFDTVFERAQRHYLASRQRRRAVAGLAAAAALTALLLQWQLPASPGLVAEDELFGSTSWSAPSDVLLPPRRTNLFNDLPELRKSTKPDGGTLL